MCTTYGAVELDAAGSSAVANEARATSASTAMAPIKAAARRVLRIILYLARVWGALLRLSASSPLAALSAFFHLERERCKNEGACDAQERRTTERHDGTEKLPGRSDSGAGEKIADAVHGRQRSEAGATARCGQHLGRKRALHRVENCNAQCSQDKGHDDCRGRLRCDRDYGANCGKQEESQQQQAPAPEALAENAGRKSGGRIQHVVRKIQRRGDRGSFHRPGDRSEGVHGDEYEQCGGKIADAEHTGAQQILFETCG